VVRLSRLFTQLPSWVGAASAATGCAANFGGCSKMWAMSTSAEKQVGQDLCVACAAKWSGHGRFCIW
jgi:hypothetical protein